MSHVAEGVMEVSEGEGVVAYRGDLRGIRGGGEAFSPVVQPLVSFALFFPVDLQPGTLRSFLDVVVVTLLEFVESVPSCFAQTVRYPGVGLEVG